MATVTMLYEAIQQVARQVWAIKICYFHAELMFDHKLLSLVILVEIQEKAEDFSATVHRQLLHQPVVFPYTYHFHPNLFKTLLAVNFNKLYQFISSVHLAITHFILPS